MSGIIRSQDGNPYSDTNPLPVNLLGSSVTVSVDVTTDAILAKYAISEIDDDAVPAYFGFTDNSGNWYILRETTSSGDTIYRYAAGTTSFSANWAVRATQSFSLFSSVTFS